MHYFVFGLYVSECVTGMLLGVRCYMLLASLACSLVAGQIPKGPRPRRFSAKQRKARAQIAFTIDQCSLVMLFLGRGGRPKGALPDLPGEVGLGSFSEP